MEIIMLGTGNAVVRIAIIFWLTAVEEIHFCGN